jgi:phage terminase large subunit
MELEFKTKNLRQLEAVEAWIDPTTDEILYGGGKGGGKSYLGASLIFGDALIYPGTHYFIARAELTDLRKFTIPTIHEVFKNWGLKIDDYMSFNGQDNCYTLKNESKVYLLACKEIPSDPLYERFGSMQMTRGWIEEGGEIAEAAKSNLWLSIGRWKNQEYNLKKKLLITANPKKGWMKRDFIDLWKSNLLPKSRKFIQALVTDKRLCGDTKKRKGCSAPSATL